MSCHEAVVDDDGMLQPCDREASGWAVDEESLYPACEDHATDTAMVMHLAVEVLRAWRSVDVYSSRSLQPVKEADVEWSAAVRRWCERREITI